MARRRPIWELEHRFHCSVAGTCLTLKELRKLLTKAGYAIPATLTDYNLHCSFVTLLGERGPLAKLTQKYLDRKFTTTIERFRPLEEPKALAELWEHFLREGEIAGPFWAVITHPRSDEKLLYRVFGDVHMLSHLCGASMRVDLERFRRLRREVPELKEKIGELQRRLQQREREIQRLLRENESIPLLQRQIEAYRLEVDRLHNGEAFRLLHRKLKALEGTLSELRHERQRLLVELENLRERSEEREGQLKTLRRELAEVIAEREALEQCLKRLLEPHRLGDRRVSLEGKRVLYVGGCCRLWPHLRAFVERQGGEFLCHDGGLEEALRRLDELIARADLVVCPLDRISHNAVFRIKQQCHRMKKAFLLVPRASFSAFVRGLIQWEDSQEREARTEAIREAVS